MLVLDEQQTGSGFCSNCMATIPPKKMPRTKNKFQASFFQSYLKKEILDGKQAAQACLSEELIPKVLFPMISNVGHCKAN
jgi:hypothetical protein